MYGNGAGTGLQIVTMQKQKEEVTQLVHRRVRLSASAAAVVGAMMHTTALFLSVASSTLTSSTATLVSVWFVPVLIKI